MASKPGSALDDIWSPNPAFMVAVKGRWNGKLKERQVFAHFSPQLFSFMKYVWTGCFLAITPEDYAKRMGIDLSKAPAVASEVNNLVKTYESIQSANKGFRDGAWKALIQCSDDIYNFTKLAGGTTTSSYYGNLMQSINDYHTAKHKSPPDQAAMAEAKASIQEFAEMLVKHTAQQESGYGKVSKGINDFGSIVQKHQEALHGNLAAMKKLLDPPEQRHLELTVESLQQVLSHQGEEYTYNAIAATIPLYAVCTLFGVLPSTKLSAYGPQALSIKNIIEAIEGELKPYDGALKCGLMVGADVQRLSGEADAFKGYVGPVIELLKALEACWKKIDSDLQHLYASVKSNEIPDITYTKEQIQKVVDSWNELGKHVDEYRKSIYTTEPTPMMIGEWSKEIDQYNESLHLSLGYLKFDPQQLLKAAVTAVSGEGARYCTNVFECREGLNNKVFILTMDNGIEVIAKLPNPVAGPAYYTTASEVATREFLRDILKIPTPRIIAWSADRSNPVGAEYILEEKAPGKPLGMLWYQWPMMRRLEIIKQIVQIEQQLASTKFSKSGCIYFKGDVPDDLCSNGILATGSSLPTSILERFTLGPLVSSNMWRGDRASMNMNRGPFDGPLEFVEAMAKNEILFTKKHARPRMNYHRSSTEPQSPDELLELLNRYLKLSPAMIPPVEVDDTHSPTLWHPDLHLDNVFIDPELNKITRIIDWQSATVMPFYYQCGIPRMFEHPGGVPHDWTLALPDNYDSLDQEEKEKFENDRKSMTCHRYYEVETGAKNPSHLAALQLRNLDVRIDPSRLVVNVWEDQAVFFLRRALNSIVERWQDLCPESGTCPVTIGKRELELRSAEEEISSSVAEILTLFRDGWGLPPDGMVHPADFERVKAAVAERRDAFFESADNETDKELYKRIWPYQDGEM
ncbi:uncharacterized protein GIQ15_02151 [Arthroderma uncinatum]|uniref:uncharacterized protein n=1 Tax=Arthroderma uncinatum TaxID=74035 RepID=UPI00144A9FB6|nr:uncharacterized protein GIQ15_02151 [Arthroderma uncinatum]KAF3482827.1 hypothetical protein GIQ15_02151 [Arthroderma uncinatum]